MAYLLRSRGFSLALALCLFAIAPYRPTQAESEGGEKIYQRLLKSAVWVLSPLGNGRASSGSGSLIDVSHRLILTNYHVVEDREQAVVFFPVYQKNKSGRLEIVAERDFYMNLRKSGGGARGKVIARSAKNDLALIQLEAVPAGAQPVRLAAQSAAPGQHVHSIGNPGGSGALWVYTSGTVRQVYHKKWPAKLRDKILELDAQVVETQSPTNHGDSGGPLVNDRAELVGVTQGGVSGDAQLLSTFIEVSEVKALLKKERIKVAQAPSVASADSPSGTSPPANPQADKAAQAERDAHRKLKLAKMMADDGLVEKAKARYQEIVESFPETKAAEEARHLLEKLDK